MTDLARLRLGPLASGLLLALAYPPFSAGPLAFVALVPFALHVAGLVGGREAARSGLFLGVAFFGVLLHWIPFSLPGRPLLAVTAYGAAVALLALATSAAGWLLHALTRRDAYPLWLALPLAWTAGEWARGALPGGFAFPWAGSALALTGSPRALALLPWVGELGVTLWISLVNGVLACAVMQRRPRTTAAYAGVALALALLPLLLGTPGVQGGALADRAAVRVAILQTAVPVAVREDPAAGASAMAAAVGRLLAPVEPGSVDLVVLPETAFPLPLEAPAGRHYLDGLRSLSARLRAPLLVGAFGVGEGSPARPTNSLLLVDERGVRARYDKRRLVPVIERNPVASSRVLAALGDRTSYEAGERRPPLDAGGLRVGSLICFESAFSGLARELRGDGAELLVLVTNDGWFGEGMAGGAARAQHEAHAVLRAVEGRTAVVRSANGGRSMWVDARGRSSVVAPPGREGIAVAALARAGAPAHALGVHGGVGPLCAAAAALLAIRAARRGASLHGAPPNGLVSKAPTG